MPFAGGEPARLGRDGVAAYRWGQCESARAFASSRGNYMFVGGEDPRSAFIGVSVWGGLLIGLLLGGMTPAAVNAENRPYLYGCGMVWA